MLYHANAVWNTSMELVILYVQAKYLILEKKKKLAELMT